MSLKGDIRSLSLANVLQDLAMNEKTGTLLIQTHTRSIRFWFEKGAIRLVGLGPGAGPSRLNGLLALGTIAPSDLPPPDSRGSEVRILRQLAKKGRIHKEDIRKALEQQMMEHVCDVFLWKEARFEFTEDEPGDDSFDVDQLDHECRLPVDALVMEALRRQDEWEETRKTILSAAEILVAEGGDSADPMTQRMASLMNGERSLNEIMDLTRLGQFTVMKAAAALIRSGAARPLSPAEACDRATRYAAAGDWKSSVKLALYGLEHERNNPALRQLAARGFESLGDRAQAITHYRLLASSQAEAEHFEEALDAYQKISTLSPNDMYAQERVFDLYIRLGRKEEALSTGEALARACKRAGLPEKAREIYARLLKFIGQETPLLESLAEIARHLGDKKDAIEFYRKLLARALDRKDRATAYDLCRTILKLNPDHEEARQLRQDLESGAYDRRRRRRRLARVLTVLALFAAILGTAAFYEAKARSRLSAIRPRLLDLQLQKSYVDAMLCYDEVLEPYPWSLAAMELRPDRDRLESLYVKEELERATSLDQSGRVIDALSVLDRAKRWVKDPHRRNLLRDLEQDLRRRRSSEESTYRDRLKQWADSADTDAIAATTDPLAVPALDQCLAHPHSGVRRAAIEALGKIPHPTALKALLGALGDSMPELASLAGAKLAVRTRQDYGLDRAAWTAWFRKTHADTPLQAVLLAPEKARVGEPLRLGWKLVNDREKEVAFSIRSNPAIGLQIMGAATIASSASDAASHRYVLRRDEYVGGLFTLPEPPAPGLYRATWTVRVTWEDGREESIDAVPISFEATAP
ncbi:MAG: DUF4388 domain-containing protein [Planctomycetes bacterium]|nr:DUF4388 domain-containing protein [Planctomycetota bacterium]